MHTTTPIFRTSVIAKAAMASSGLLLAGWLTLHMAANLLVFADPALMNGYALRLRATGLLWPMRALMSALLLAHIAGAWVTTRRSESARPIPYQVARRTLTSTWSARSMRLGGLLLAVYLVYHVAHLYGVGHASFVPHDVHHNLTSALRSPVHAVLYTLASGVLALHLRHGVVSALRSLGLVTEAGQSRLEHVLLAWASLVSLGFALPGIALGLGW